MALFLLCKSPAGPVRMKRIQLLLCCFVLSLIIYFFNGHKPAVNLKSAHPLTEVLGMKDGTILKDMSAIKTVDSKTPQETSWGAPLVWGDSHNSVGRRARLSERGIHVGLLALVVGTYARFVRHFLSSAETHFLPGQMVTYYILTDNPRTMDPPVELGPGRQIKVLPAAELPGWDGLAYRRMVLFAEAIWDLIGNEVDYIFCTDVDQEFVGPVEEEILGDLVATLHPEFFQMPRNQFPYEDQEDSSACVEEDEGDYYYTSEFYGGVVSQMRRLARDCSLLILQDQANKVTARALEESYLNRYLIDHRPSCVLSPEYSWWDSPMTAHVPKKRQRETDGLFKQSMVLSINVRLRDTSPVALWSAAIRHNRWLNRSRCFLLTANRICPQGQIATWNGEEREVNFKQPCASEELFLVYE